MILEYQAPHSKNLESIDTKKKIGKPEKKIPTSEEVNLTISKYLNFLSN